jgi:hypothetical protein
VTAWTDPGPIVFEAVLQATRASGAACYVEFPHDLKATYGKGNLVPVRVVWDGRVTYRGSLARMGGPLAIVLCRKDVVAALHKAAGDRVTVRVELDLDPRDVEPPEALRAAIDGTPGASAGWAKLSASCRRAYADWVGGAKREETRARRAAEAAPRIAAGERRT